MLIVELNKNNLKLLITYYLHFLGTLIGYNGMIDTKLYEYRPTLCMPYTSHPLLGYVNSLCRNTYLNFGTILQVSKDKVNGLYHYLLYFLRNFIHFSFLNLICVLLMLNTWSRLNKSLYRLYES